MQFVIGSIKTSSSIHRSVLLTLQKQYRNFNKNADGSFQFLFKIFEVKTMQTFESLKTSKNTHSDIKSNNETAQPHIFVLMIGWVEKMQCLKRQCFWTAI